MHAKHGAVQPQTLFNGAIATGDHDGANDMHALAEAAKADANWDGGEPNTAQKEYEGGNKECGGDAKDASATAVHRAGFRTCCSLVRVVLVSVPSPTKPETRDIRPSRYPDDSSISTVAATLLFYQPPRGSVHNSVRRT